MNYTQESIADSVRIPNSIVMKINDLKTLGAYVFFKMMLDQSIYLDESGTFPKIVQKICDHFSLSKDEVLSEIEKLRELELLYIAMKEVK